MLWWIRWGSNHVGKRGTWTKKPWWNRKTIETRYLLTFDKEVNLLQWFTKQIVSSFSFWQRDRSAWFHVYRVRLRCRLSYSLILLRIFLWKGAFWSWCHIESLLVSHLFSHSYSSEFHKVNRSWRRKQRSSMEEVKGGGDSAHYDIRLGNCMQVDERWSSYI